MAVITTGYYKMIFQFYFIVIFLTVFQSIPVAEHEIPYILRSLDAQSRVHRHEASALEAYRGT